MRTLVLIDGQNLYHLAKSAWGNAAVRADRRYSWPSYDVEKVASMLTSKIPGRCLAEVRFYTGVPDPRRGGKHRMWYEFWNNKLRDLNRRGIYVYRGRVSNGQEKGVDVSLAIDLIQATHERRYEIAIIVSQDWDFGPAVKLAKQIALCQSRNVRIESAFPVGPGTSSKRGVPGTTWVRIEKADYDGCYDPTDYRPRFHQ